MAETSTIFGFMKYVSATDILSDFKKTVDSYFVNSLRGCRLLQPLSYTLIFIMFYLKYEILKPSSKYSTSRSGSLSLK